MRCKKCNAVISSNTLNCPCCGQYNAYKKEENREVELQNEISVASISSKKEKKPFFFSVGGLIIIAILLIGGIAIYSVCVGSFGDAVVESVEESEKVELITIEKIVELSKKGEDLNWEDFKDYSYIDAGKSGYQLLHYKIDDTFELIVSGMWTNKPDGIELVLIEDNTIGVDIREEDIKTFVEQYSEN